MTSSALEEYNKSIEKQEEYKSKGREFNYICGFHRWCRLITEASKIEISTKYTWRYEEIITSFCIWSKTIYTELFYCYIKWYTTFPISLKSAGNIILLEILQKKKKKIKRKGSKYSSSVFAENYLSLWRWWEFQYAVMRIWNMGSIHYILHQNFIPGTIFSYEKICVLQRLRMLDFKETYP